MSPAVPVLALMLAFGLGSIPTALLWARARGIDLLKVGSGNLGATNVYRTLGPRAGLTVLAVDLLKGIMAVVLVRALPGWWNGETAEAASRAPSVLPVAGAGAAVMGHVLSPFAGFRGGKGVATGAGAMLVLAPAATLLAIAIFGVTLALTRFVSLGSILGAASLPLAVMATARHVPGLVWASVAIAVLIIGRHWSNIGRLVRGTERRFSIGGRSEIPQAPPSEPPAGGRSR